MDNLEYLGIYENQIDKVVGMTENLVQQADYDLDDFNENVLDLLCADNPPFKEITPAINSCYLSEASAIIIEAFEKYGFTVEVDYNNDGVYSDITINGHNQTVLQAVNDIVKGKFGFLDDIDYITEDLMKNTTSLENYFYYAVEDITAAINEVYGLDLDCQLDDYTVKSYVDGDIVKSMTFLEYRDMMESIVKEKTAELDKQ